MINKRTPFLLVPIVLFSFCVGQLSAADTQPNILFLAVDDMNDWIGCLETTPHAITPNIDRLAAGGVTFTNAHTAGVFCAPSRAAVFSGQYASTTGCYQTPNYCPQKYFDLYDPANIELPPIREDDLEDLPPKARKQRQNRKRQHYEKLVKMGALDDAIHGYLACISYADAMLGRVLSALESSPYADNTIVVLWSDHGYHHGEKGQWGKHTLWERTSNVPFIWAGPGVAEGAKTDVTVSLIDIYPTFVEMCGLPQPYQPLEGKSRASTLSSPSTAKDRSVFLPYMTPGEYAVINRDWRYIRYGDDGEELYNLREDPNEWNNLASDVKFADVKAELQKSAPKTFAAPEDKLKTRKDLVVEGETFRWEKGKGNYTPLPKYRPYTSASAAQ
jgi:arylsulfatase A-like enzyme